MLGGIPALPLTVIFNIVLLSDSCSCNLSSSAHHHSRDGGLSPGRGPAGETHARQSGPQARRFPKGAQSTIASRRSIDAARALVSPLIARDIAVHDEFATRDEGTNRRSRERQTFATSRGAQPASGS